MTVTLSQDAEDLDLAWVQGDPLSLAFNVPADWSGTYTAQVKAKPKPDAPVLLALTVTATYSSPNTAFTLTATAAANTIGGGRYYWDMQQAGGVTRLSGQVRIRPEVTT